ncbi:MAG TPA: signal peptidase II [Myxococcota bacterium]|nr:signal peptidase II [Myxococcota bacterium]
MLSKRLVFSSVFVVVFVLDRAGKQYVLGALEPGERAALLGHLLSLVHTRVSSAAFGLMRGWEGSTQILVLGLLTLGCALVVGSFYRGLARGEIGSAGALGAVLAGVFGNFLDRLRHGVGIDFLHLGPVTAESMPDFDLSDLAIALGVLTLIAELLASEMAARVEERPRR